jgi:hypothetical protein
MFSDLVESSVKYLYVCVYILTGAAKMHRDSAWWVVLLGRYPPKK